VLSAAVPIKAQPESKAQQGTKSKRTAEKRANRKARKAERMAKKRAERRAASEQSNAEHNPRRTKKAAPSVGRVEARNDTADREQRAPGQEGPVRRGPEKASRPSHRSPRERSTRSRVAIGILLALGLMLGFWLLFKLPAK
jgi:cobalamin biosynthesis Mg chelatase CobN